MVAATMKGMVAKYVTRGLVIAARAPPERAPSTSEALCATRTRPISRSKNSLDPVSSTTMS